MRIKKLLLLLAMMLCTSVAFAQLRVTGTVVDKDNEPLIGATVTEKGRPGNGTATDLDGHFTLTVQSKKSKLVVASIGYKQQELNVSEGAMTITLEELRRTWMARMGENCVFISAKNKENIEELKRLLYTKAKEIHSQRFPYNDYLYVKYDEE